MERACKCNITAQKKVSSTACKAWPTAPLCLNGTRQIVLHFHCWNVWSPINTLWYEYLANFLLQQLWQSECNHYHNKPLYWLHTCLTPGSSWFLPCRESHSHAKALYRRAMAFSALGEFEKAQEDFIKWKEVDSSATADADAQIAKLNQQQKAANAKQKQQFRNFFDRTWNMFVICMTYALWLFWVLLHFGILLHQSTGYSVTLHLSICCIHMSCKGFNNINTLHE